MFYPGVKLQVVTPNEVTWNSAVISWKSTHIAFRSYRLTYQFGEEVKVIMLEVFLPKEYLAIKPISHF